jgi:mRNA turnover protein 4
MKDIKTEWKSSRFFFGKNKVMAKALGTTPEEELRPNLSKLANVNIIHILLKVF